MNSILDDVESSYLNTPPPPPPSSSPPPPRTSKEHILSVQLNMARDRLDHHPWFIPALSRRAAESLLLPLSPGTFLLRLSNSAPNCFAMSWRSHTGPGVEHNLVFCLNPGYALSRNPAHPSDFFCSLPSLVAACQHFLRHPFSRPSPLPSAQWARDLSIKCSSDVFGALLDLLRLPDSPVLTLSWKLLLLARSPLDDRDDAEAPPSIEKPEKPCVSNNAQAALDPAQIDVSLTLSSSPLEHTHLSSSISDPLSISDASSPILSSSSTSIVNSNSNSNSNSTSSSSSSFSTFSSIAADPSFHHRTLIEYGRAREHYYLSSHLMPITGPSLSLLASTLRAHPHLRQLALTGHPGGIYSACDATPHLPNLADRDALLLLGALRHNASLELLDLSANALSRQSSQALAALLRAHPRLQFVDVQFNFFDFPSALLLAACATRAPRIQALKIDRQLVLDRHGAAQLSNDSSLLSAAQDLRCAFERLHELGRGATKRLPWFHGVQPSPEKVNRLLVRYRGHPQMRDRFPGYYLFYIDPLLRHPLQLAVLSAQRDPFLALPSHQALPPRLVYSVPQQDAASPPIFLLHYTVFPAAGGYSLHAAQQAKCQVPSLQRLSQISHVAHCARCQASSKAGASCFPLDWMIAELWQPRMVHSAPSIIAYSIEFSNLQRLSALLLGKFKSVKEPRASSQPLIQPQHHPRKPLLPSRHSIDHQVHSISF